MQLTSEFTVAAPIEEVWSLLIDVERVAPNIPGFQLLEIEGDEYRGKMRVKVGAVVSEYAGQVEFVECDNDNHRAVLVGRGREVRGQGNVDAKMVSTLIADGSRTQVSVTTDLNVAGRIAQFGRGILADVSDRLTQQFANNLEAHILSNRNSN